MVITFDPVVVSIGPLAVRWFGLLALVGLGVAIALSLREIAQQKIDRGVALSALAWGLPAGVLAARLVQLLGNWDYYLTNSAELWQLNLDGLSLWGGLLGGLAVAAARLKRDPYRRRRVLDAIAPNAAFGIAIGRFGAFLDGHGQGLPSALPWATQYTSPLAATPDFGVPRHPVQLYDALLALAVYALLSALPHGWPPGWRPLRLLAGVRVAGFLVLYGCGRVALGQVRLDAAFLFGLQIEQLLALGAVVFGVWFGVRPVLSQMRRPGVAAEVQASGATAARAKEDIMAA